MTVYKGTELIAGIATVVDKSERIGQIITSAIPLSDAGLHLLDGALISGSGIYSDFVDYIATLSSSNPECFDTEANWQSAVAANGVCGKFVYDSVNNTVRLPKYSNKIYTSNPNSLPVIGNGMSLGITDGTDNGGLAYYSNGYLLTETNKYGVNVGTSSSYAYPSTTAHTSLGITTDGSKSGIIADLANITTALDGYWYIVVATSTKTDIEVDIDEIATDLNGKADVDLTNVSNTSGFRKLVEIYNNGTDWYKVYSEYNPSTGVYIGQWCEQGGVLTGSFNKTYSFPLLKPLSGTYTVIGNATYSSQSASWCVIEQNANSFKGEAARGSSANVTYTGLYWYACGYLATT